MGLAEGMSLVTLAGFMSFWGYVFIITTLIVWIFKKEDMSPISNVMYYYCLFSLLIIKLFVFLIIIIIIIIIE